MVCCVMKLTPASSSLLESTNGVAVVSAAATAFPASSHSLANSALSASARRFGVGAAVVATKKRI